MLKKHFKLSIISIILLLIFFSGCFDDLFQEKIQNENNPQIRKNPIQEHRVNFKISDTGQSLGYTSTHGEDNDYSNHPEPSFTDNSDGTIQDNVTGLMWTKCTLVNGGDDPDNSACSGDNHAYKW